MKTINQQLAEIRQEKGISQQQLAEMVGMAQQSINRFEAGQTNPTISTIDKIAHALGYELKLKNKLNS